MYLTFALHGWFQLALANSHGDSCTSVGDAATPPEKATRVLFKRGVGRESPAGIGVSDEEKLEGSFARASVQLAGVGVGVSDDENLEGSFAAASMQLQLKLRGEGKCTSSTGCPVWHGSLDEHVCSYYGWYSPAWGNLLSEYWEARGAAALAGVKYEGTPIPGDTWLSKLPSEHNADPAFKDEISLDKICKDEVCLRHDGMFPHICVGKWTRIRQLIRDDTQAALQAYSHVPTNERLPAFNEHDMLVHIRFDKGHPQIAYYAKSFFDGHIPSGTSRIILLSNEPQWGMPILESYIALFKELCHNQQPQCQVERQSGTQFSDFASIALAPTVFCSGSTYCLWAAMANRGNATMSSHHIANGMMPPIDDWTWVAGHVLSNSEKPKGMSLEDWVSHVAEWVRKN